MKNKKELMQDPRTHAILCVIFGLSAASLCEEAVPTVQPNAQFDIIDRLQTGVVQSMGSWLGSPENSLAGLNSAVTADQVEAIFEVFAKEIEDHLENTILRAISLTASEAI